MKSKYSYRREWYEEIIRHPSGYYVEPFRIFGNLYFVGTADSSSHLVDTGDGLILFDTGYPNMAGLLIHAIWECGFRPQDIKKIIHTHGHFDHFGATKFLTTITDAVTYIGKKDAQMFRERPELALCDYLDGILTEPFSPDVELEDGDVIELGNTRITAVHTPGHSEGAMTYLFSVSDGKEKYQALLCGGTGFNTLNRDFIEEYDLNWRPDFENSIIRWKQMRADIYLGNHTNQSHTLQKRERMGKECGNPFINSTDWTEYVKEIKKNYQRMLAEEG